jgi:hypothetical protein
VRGEWVVLPGCRDDVRAVCVAELGEGLHL